MASKQDSISGWSHPEGVAYEIAQDTLTQLVAAAGQHLARLQNEPRPDRAQIAIWEARRAAWAQRRLDLSPADVIAAQQVLGQDAQTLRSLQAGRWVRASSPSR
jgi:hypothetical protein